MEGTFDLKDFIINILRQWKLIVVLSLVLGVALGGMKWGKGLQDLKHFESADIQQDSEDLELQNNLKDNIKTLNEGIHNWDEYYANSKLMQIDSYNAKRYGLVFIVEQGEKEEVNSAAEACKKVIDNGKYNEDLSKESGLDIEDIKELIRTDVSGNCIEIRGYQLENENMGEIIESLYEKITEEIESGIFGEVQVRKISADYYIGRDDKLIELKDKIISNGDKYITEATARSKVLEEIKEETGVLEVTRTSVIHSAIKYGVFGMIGGIVLGVLLGMFRDMMSTRLKSEKELENELGMKCFGDSSLLKSKENIVDKTISRLEGKKNVALEDDEWEKYICARIYNEIDAERLVFTSTLDNDEITLICNNIRERLNLDNKGISCDGCSNVIYTSEALDKIAKADGVVLFERLNQSDLIEIEKVQKIIQEMNKKILGFVMV